MGVTVLEVIQRSTDFLAKKGVESPRLQVELLLAQVLKIPRMGLYLNFEKTVPEAELNQLREFVRRRGQREPLQHIQGSACFCGLDFEVNSHVLVPRPETEQLAELGWKFLQGSSSKPPLALDFGTGSGCLAVTVAAKVPTACIQAVDISPEALGVAARNAARHQVSDRVQFFVGNGFSVVPASTVYDLILANPPYIPTAEIATLDPEVRDHDPRLALDGGPDGLDFYRRLASEAPGFLRSGGRLLAEFGDGQGEGLRELFVSQKWIVEELKADYDGRLRILVARRQ